LSPSIRPLLCRQCRRFFGCSDVVIATRNSSIGMGGPAMIEGGNLGVFAPEEVGPMSVQVPNGTVDIAVEDEAEAVPSPRSNSSYFPGRAARVARRDQRLLRRVIRRIGYASTTCAT
jgi:acetyl-CoA carboxylase carboxyltransferase component